MTPPGESPSTVTTTSLRGVSVLIGNWIFVSTGFFMLYPLLSVHYIQHLGFSAAAVGLVLATRAVTQQGLTTIGGSIADQIGYKPCIVAGMYIRAVGFVLFAYADSAAILFLAAAVSGLGGMLFEGNSRAAIASLTTPGDSRQRAYAVGAIVSNLGSTLGPLLGVLLLQFDFSFVALTAAVLFAFGATLTTFLLPARKSTQVRPGVGETLESIKSVFSDVRFVKFTGALCVYWFLNAQLFVALPLAALALTGRDET